MVDWVWWVWPALLVAVAFVGALAVAPQRPGRARNATAWIATVAFYAVLVGMFWDFTLDAIASGSKARYALGFLAALFSIGLPVALFKAGLSFRSGGAGPEGATH
jgi:hypothetical protein